MPLTRLSLLLSATALGALPLQAAEPADVVATYADIAAAAYGDAALGSKSLRDAVATPRFTLAGTGIDATAITHALISGTLHDADGIQTNVASGWHAV